MISAQQSLEDVAVPELQAIIMAGGAGTRMTELTSDRPKCLLPVGNKPMIYYPIKCLERVHMTDSQKKDVMDKLSERFQNIKLEFISVPDNLGTAESLRLAKDKIKSDVIIMSCDMITDFNLISLINLFRKHDLSLAALISSSNATLTQTPGGKTKAKLEKDIIGFDVKNSERLVFLSSEADFTSSVPMKLSMIQRCPEFEIHRNFLDAHLYIMRKWVVNYLIGNPHITSLKGEFLPYLTEMQFKPVKRDEQDKKNIFNWIQDTDFETRCLEFDPRDPEDDDNYGDEDDFRGLFLKKSSDESHNYPEGKLRCGAKLMTDGYCLRCNNVNSYLLANRRVAHHQEFWFPEIINQGKPKKCVESLLGKNSIMDEKSSVIRSVVGKKCKLASDVKIIESLLMDGVEVQEGCCIEGSIICRNVVIEKNCVIKNCIVTQYHRVPSGGNVSNDVVPRGTELDQWENSDEE